MSKRNTIVNFLIALAVLVAIGLVGLYFYKKNNAVNTPHVPTQAEIEEAQRKELASYKLDSSKVKTEAEQKKELGAFKLPASKTKITEDQMRQALTSNEIKQ